MSLEYQIRETKLQGVCNELIRLLNQLGPNAKLPTVRDLTDTLSASGATINHALQELEQRSLIVRKHGIGIFVSASLPTRRIALVCRPEIFSIFGSSPFWGLLVRHTQQRAQQKQEELAFWFTVEDTLSEAQRKMLTEGHYQGVIGIGLGYALMQWIKDQEVPYVAFAGPGAHTVVIDHASLHEAGTSALKALGCRTIMEIPWSHASPSQQASGYEWGVSLLERSRHNLPEGIVSTDDMQTLGLLGAMHEKGFVLGKDFHVATHANAGSPVLLGWQEELIRLTVSPEEIVQQLFALLEVQLSATDPVCSVCHATITTVIGERLLAHRGE